VPDVNLTFLEQRVRTLENALLSGQQTNLNTFDTNGILRLEAGNLPARGSSAAGYKVRANDKNGNPIFDSDGLIQVDQRIATSLIGAGTLALTGSYQSVPGSSTSFTLTRQQTVLVQALLVSYTTSGLGTSDPARANIFVNGVQYVGGFTGNQIQYQGGGGILFTEVLPMSCPAWAVATLPAGTYTADWRAVSGGNSPSLSINQGQIDVFLLGG
jgi:hypothetical protein